MSSLYFGMMHGNLNQFFYATVLGIFMAFLVKITNSIYSSILLHFIFNFKSVIALYFIDKFGNMSFNELNEPTTILDVRNWVIFFLISLPFLLLSIFLFTKNNKDEINKLKDENIIIKNNPNKPKVFTIFFYINIIIFILKVLFLELMQSFLIK